MVERYVAARARAGHPAGSTSCAATRPTSTSGARSTSPSSASSSDGRASDESPPRLRSLPRARARRPLARGRARSGSSRSSRPAPTAARRSTSTTSSRASTRRATTCRSSRCRRAAPSASSSGPASTSLVIDEPDDAIAVGTLAAHLADVRADVVHNHMYPRRDRRHEGGHRPRRGRPPPAVRHLDRPFVAASAPTRTTSRCAA